MDRLFNLSGTEKKKTKNHFPPTTEKKKSFFESLLDEVTEKISSLKKHMMHEITPELETIEADENIFEEKKFSYDDYYEERNYEEAEDALSESESFEKSIFDQQLKPVEEKKVNHDLI